MSTQLILYPQSYQGVTTNFNEFVIDGIAFSSINISTSYSTAILFDAHVLATPPGSPNTWYRWINTSAGTPAYPLESSGNLVINAVSPASISGVYQELSSLIVGVSYTLTVNFTSVAGLLNLKVYNGSTLSLITGPLLTTVATQQTINFIAETTSDIIAILYYNLGATDLTISSISLLPTNASPSEIYSELQDGQVICDLYQEEDIPLTLSVDNFKNVAEKVQSYSKDFNLPATKRNNQIFNNMFEVTRADDGLIFNPYTRTQCILKQDGFILFEGYLRLIDVKDKEGEISYNVNLYSEVVALADTLKDRTFSNLDLSELDHTYNITNILYSWADAGTSIPYINPNTSGFRDAYKTLRYPFIDWNHQCTVDPSTASPNLPNLESTFRPCIQLKYLINRIFAASGFNWTSDFFDSADFDKLYMDFNWGGDSLPTPTNTYDASWEYGSGASSNPGTGSFTELRLLPETSTGGVAGSTVPPNYDPTTHIITATTDNEIYNISYGFRLRHTDTGIEALECQWEYTPSGGAAQTIDYVSVNMTSLQIFFYFGYFQIALQTGDTLSAQFNATSDVEQDEVSGYASSAQFVQSNSTSTSATLLTLRGELGQWDFLKGILTMFNLVTMVDETDPNNILIEPYADVFLDNSDSKRLDWTDKIDASQMELKPLTDLNKNTIFKFVEDDDDYVFGAYKKSTSGHLYGSKEIDASTSTNGLATILQGTKEIIAEPFAATVSKPLMPIYYDLIIPSIYAMNEDGTSEGFDNSPRIFYNNGEPTLTSCSPHAPAQNGVGDYYFTTFLQFSHLTTIPSVSLTTTDFVFESSQLFSGVGQPPTDNLYSTYWQPYFNELYNADTRTMILKVNLTPADINTFKFDTVFIKNRAFRVNKIEYKPNDLAKVEFILIP